MYFIYIKKKDFYRKLFLLFALKKLYKYFIVNLVKSQRKSGTGGHGVRL